MAKAKPNATPAAYHHRLDPLLSLTAARAKVEGKAVIAALGARATSFVARAETARPDSIAALPVGLCSFAGQVSSAAVSRLLHEDRVTVLVDAGDVDQVAKKVAAWNGSSRRLSRSTLLVHTPRSRLRDLAALKGVAFVEASTRLRPHLDLAHLSAGLVRAGSRTVAQRGRGVLVGMVDTGIDVSHPAFKKAGKTRLLSYLDQNTGKEYSRAQIDAGAASAAADEIGHGTHVMGIAAGNGGGSPQALYQGVAPEADIAAVKTTFDSADIAAGVAHIFDVARKAKLPCVVNLSLGGHFGAHDGSSVAERTLDDLSGPGRLVVVSAGNEGGTSLHASTVLAKGQTPPARWTADLELRPRLVQGDLIGLLVVQAWNQHEDDVTVRLRSPSGELFAPPADGDAEFDRGVFLVQANRQRAAYSGDFSTTFQIVAVAQPQWLSGWSLVVEEDRAAGKHGVEVGAVHAWVLQQEMGRFVSGDTRSHLVGMPGTAYSAITVASYATRGGWPSRDPAKPEVVLEAMHLEDISYFSSPGPTREGGNKPEIAAPGQWLLSALSSGAAVEEMPLWLRLPDIEYAALQGTSMAAPYVSGALALLLEKDAKIDWAEAKRRLIKSAKQDSFTTPCWNARWGYGKIDLEKLLTLEPS